jgi:hypothetical protein
LTTRDVRFFSLYQYMIVYRQAAMVEIVAVLHGKRDARHDDGGDESEANFCGDDRHGCCCGKAD